MTYPRSAHAHLGTRILALFLLLFVVVASGCGAKEKVRSRYKDDELRQAQSVLYGTVVNVSEIQVRQDLALATPLAGGVIGGAAGIIVSAIVDLGGATNAAFAVGGATLGLLMSGADDEPAHTYEATELTVELENGGVLVIVLANQDFFVRGDVVRIIGLGESQVRVQHR